MAVRQDKADRAAITADPAEIDRSRPAPPIDQPQPLPPSPIRRRQFEDREDLLIN
jgi:hypothetical protein